MTTIDTTALRTTLLRESAAQRETTRANAVDALRTPLLTPYSRAYFTATLEILDTLPTPAQDNRHRTAHSPTSNQYGTYAVRPISPKQLRYLRHLLATRDYSGTSGPIRASINRAATAYAAEQEHTLSLSHVRTVISALVTYPVIDHPDAHAESIRLTEGQESFIRRLVAERDTTNVPLPEDLSTIPRSDVDKVLSALKAAPYRSRATTSPDTPGVTEGMYKRADGAIYKVQRSRESQRLYAKRLNQDTQTFEYASGALRSLTPADRMTLDEAKAYGALYGTCCVCSRTLTDETSIENGIGPVCAGKTQWA